MQVQKAKPGYKFVQTSLGKYVEIPNQWDYPKFSAVVKVNPSTKIDDKQVPYLPMDAIDVDAPHFNYFEERELDQFSSLPKFQENDVLFARITPSTENGKTCIIENFSRKGICSSELTILRPSDKVVPKYLYYYVKSERIRNFAISQMMGTTGRQRVPDEVFKEYLNFELPPYQEQQKISLILANVDSLIRQTQRNIEQIQHIQKILSEKLLTQGIRHTKFKKVRINFGKHINIPDEFQIQDFRNLVFFQEGPGLRNWQFTDNGMKIINVKNLVEGELDVSNTSRFIALNEFNEKYAHFSINADDIVVSSSGWSYGKVAIVKKSDLPLMMNTSVIRFKSLDEKKLDQNYLYFFLNSDFFRNQIELLITGIDIPNFGSSHLNKALILIPNIEEQKQISNILHNMELKIKKEKYYKVNIENLRKGLMQKLLTGQIRVKI